MSKKDTERQGHPDGALRAMDGSLYTLPPDARFSGFTQVIKNDQGLMRTRLDPRPSVAFTPHPSYMELHSPKDIRGAAALDTAKFSYDPLDVVDFQKKGGHILGVKDDHGDVVAMVEATIGPFKSIPYLREMPDKTLYFLGVAVREDKQDQNLGSAAYSAVESFARENGCTTMESTFNPFNIRSGKAFMRQFWNGYELVERFYPDPDDDMVKSARVKVQKDLTRNKEFRPGPVISLSSSPDLSFDVSHLDILSLPFEMGYKLHDIGQLTLPNSSVHYFHFGK